MRLSRGPRRSLLFRRSVCFAAKADVGQASGRDCFGLQISQSACGGVSTLVDDRFAASRLVNFMRLVGLFSRGPAIYVGRLDDDNQFSRPLAEEATTLGPSVRIVRIFDSSSPNAL